MRHVLSLLFLPFVVAGCASTGEPQWLASRVVHGLPFFESTDPRYARLVQSEAPEMTAVSETDGPVLELRRAATLPENGSLWLAPDGSSFMFEEGLLIATRGFDQDVMSSDLSQLQSLLETGRDGTAERFHTVLNGEGQIVLKSYVCGVSIRGNIVQEDCSGLEEAFVNTYRIAPERGGVLSSRQQIGTAAYNFGGSQASNAARPSSKEKS